MTILVCGSREWRDESAIRLALKWAAGWSNVRVVHGGAQQGADRIANAIARQMGFDVQPYPADWKRYDKAAGPIRNQQMLDAESPDVVLAFPLPGSKGTRDMIQRARADGVPTWEHGYGWHDGKTLPDGYDWHDGKTLPE